VDSTRSKQKNMKPEFHSQDFLLQIPAINQ